MIQHVTELKVGLDFGNGIQPVGRLAQHERTIYFEYDAAFLQSGLNISPVRLPLQKGVIALPPHPFEGLAGVFSDSLPDGWGRLLLDRMLRSKNILSSDISSLDRLAYVGLHGMGVLVYEPDTRFPDDPAPLDLDHLAEQARQVMEGSADRVIETLLALNGSSAGARPKALIGLDQSRQQISYGAGQLPDNQEAWLVKFPNTQDGAEAGAIEYVYALMAKAAGVAMPDVHLFPSRNGCGYFAVRRFDREGRKRWYMHTAAGLLHSDYRAPSLDYEDLLTLTGALTRDIREVEKIYRLAVFNVLAHNRDDHAKNISFLMNETGEWKLSPSYDLTFSQGPNGEQSTMVMGEGKNLGVRHLKMLGREARLPSDTIQTIINQTRGALHKWPELAALYGVSKATIQLIDKRINQSS